MKKAFDCVEFMHESQRALKKRSEKMTPEQQAADWERRTEELRARQQRLQTERFVGAGRK